MNKEEYTTWAYKYISKQRKKAVNTCDEADAICSGIKDYCKNVYGDEDMNVDQFTSDITLGQYVEDLYTKLVQLKEEIAAAAEDEKAGGLFDDDFEGL